MGWGGGVGEKGLKRPIQIDDGNKNLQDSQEKSFLLL